MSRVAVLIPCHGEGALVAEAVRSVREVEPVEIVVVDDASRDEATKATLDELERGGARVIRRSANGGVGVARTEALEASSSPYVYPLDADDLAIPGVLARMADRLDADPEAAACVGDVVEFGAHELVRRSPERLDPYRVALTNEYPVTALYRKTSVSAAGPGGHSSASRATRTGTCGWGWLSEARGSSMWAGRAIVAGCTGSGSTSGRARGTLSATSRCASRIPSCSPSCPSIVVLGSVSAAAHAVPAVVRIARRDPAGAHGQAGVRPPGDLDRCPALTAALSPA